MFFFSMCVGLVIQDFDQIRAYNNHETGQYSAKHSRSHESTGVDNTDRQNIITDLLRHNGLAFCVPWRDFFNKADDVCCYSFDVIFGLLFQSSCTILCHSITWFSPESRLSQTECIQFFSLHV